MSAFTTEDAVRITLGGATNKLDDSKLSTQQVQEIVDYLKSPGSGPDPNSSFIGYVDEKLNSLSVKLPYDVDYVFYSGKDRFGDSNYQKAKDYIEAREGRAGLIGDTNYGQHIVDVESNPAKHADFGVMERKLASFMEARGVQPLYGDHGGALRDVMWNAGSPQYMENAIARGRPTIGFVDGAPNGRGFAGLELPTALDHPQHRFNGHSMGQFQPEALEFARDSSFDQDALYRSLAESATLNDGKPVTVLDIHRRLAPVHGYDALNQTLFNRPVADYASFGLDEMTNARMQAMIAPHTINPALKAGGIAGLALLAHDFGTSGHKWVELHNQGNAAGAYSTAAHFVGRNVGGAFGGFVAGAGVGLTTGSWTGPVAIITGIGGGALGAYLGERWADQKDIDHIYKQEDPLGRTWTRNPADPEGRWMRGAHQQQVQGSDLGTGPEVRPVQTAQGDDVTFRADYVATGTLERQLNWQAARASYELGLNNPPAPRDPYRLSAANMDGPRGAFETGRDFVRDPRSQQWELEIREAIDGRSASTRHEPVSAEQALALDEQSRTVIAQNAANTPAAMAARYMVAYEQGRWSDFGDKDNPSIPTAIQKARDGADTLVASDGDKYTRQGDGQWIHNGTFLDASANANVRQELETTWKSQQAGVEELGAVAAEARATTRIPNEGVRGQVDALYARHGIERTEEQLAATATAVQQSLGSEGKLTDVTLELVPDAHTRRPSAESAIAALADGGNNVLELRGTTTPDDVARVLAQQSLREPDTAPLPDALDLRIDALSPQQWEAHQQALHEANRQGASTEEALQAATLAAQQAGAPRPGPVQEPQPAAGIPRPQTAQSAEPTPPQRDAVTLAAAQAAAIPATADAAKQEPDAKAQATPQRQEQAKAEVTRERARHEEARATEREATAQQEDARREPLVREAQPATQPAPDIHAAQTHAAEAATPPEPTTTAPPTAAAPLVPDAEAQRAEPPVEERGTDQAVQPPRAEHTPEPIVFAPNHESGTGRATAPAEPVAPPAVPEPQPPALSDPREPGHPDHRLYQQVREHVTRLDATYSRQYDELSERFTGSLMVLAKSNGLSSVDHVVMSKATPNAVAGQNVFVVQGELDNPAHKRATMQTEAAVTAPFEQSQAKLEELDQQEQAKVQMVADQQRELDERVQREMNPPLRMG